MHDSVIIEISIYSAVNILKSKKKNKKSREKMLFTWYKLESPLLLCCRVWCLYHDDGELTCHEIYCDVYSIFIYVVGF